MVFARPFSPAFADCSGETVRARPGTVPAIPLPRRRTRERDAVPVGTRSADRHTRKPMLSFRLFGLFLLRIAHRALFVVLFHAPPRRTRGHLRDRPRNSGLTTACRLVSLLPCAILQVDAPLQPPWRPHGDTAPGTTTSSGTPGEGRSSPCQGPRRQRPASRSAGPRGYPVPALLAASSSGCRDHNRAQGVLA